MTVTAVQTRRVTAGDRSLDDFLDESVRRLEPGSILAISSKIVALSEGRVVPQEGTSKAALVEREAQAYLPRSSSRYDVSLAIKGNVLIPSAGVDESNTDGDFVLWPADPQASANAAWRHLTSRWGATDIGVIITDSTTMPLRMGVCGIPIAHCGFRALNDFVGTPDLFGRPLEMTRANVALGIAAAAVVVMGEAAEQTPLAIVSDLPFVRFEHREPTAAELASLTIAPEDDLYAPLLEAVEWRRGGHAL